MQARNISAAATDGLKGRDPMTDRNTEDTGPRSLSGGNPQIPKGEGAGPVRDYIAAMPEWKRNIGQHLDELDAGRLRSWIEQAGRLPGEKM